MADLNNFPITIRRGDCFDLVVTWMPNGEDIDMTGFAAEFTVSWPAQNDVPEGDVDLTPTIDPLLSTTSVHMEATDTLEIPIADAVVYQMRVTDGEGCKFTIATGLVTVQQSYLDA